MSDLRCIDDDLEEELARSIKNLNLMVLEKDFDIKGVCQELEEQPIRLKFLGQAIDTLSKLTVNYVGFVTQLSMALDLNLIAAEARMKKRTVPKILKKIDEGRPRISKTEEK